jgi:hypothetical protein
LQTLETAGARRARGPTVDERKEVELEARKIDDRSILELAEWGFEWVGECGEYVQPLAGRS